MPEAGATASAHAARFSRSSRSFSIFSYSAAVPGIGSRGFSPSDLCGSVHLRPILLMRLHLRERGFRRRSTLIFETCSSVSFMRACMSAMVFLRTSSDSACGRWIAGTTVTA